MGTVTGHLAEVTPLYATNSRDVVTTLRVIADQIEAGKNGNVQRVTLVIEGDILDICLAGDGTSDHAHLALCLGQRKLERLMMEKYEE